VAGSLSEGGKDSISKYIDIEAMALVV